MTQKKLTDPPTEAELAHVIQILTVDPEVQMIVRRLAFQRDSLRNALDRLRHALDKILEAAERKRNGTLED